MRILIGYDGSKHSDAALDDLNLAGLPRIAKSLVVTVADPLTTRRSVQEVVVQAMPPRSGFSIAGEPQLFGGCEIEAEDFALKAADRLFSEFPGWEVSTQTRTGMAAWELIDVANNWDADLVIVGCEGIPVVERTLLGSVSKRVVIESRRSVRVARLVEGRKPNAQVKIIVGVDGSPAAQEAVHEIGRRVWPTGTQVRLVTAHEQPLVSHPSQNMERSAESMLDWAKYHLKSRGLNVSMSIRPGDPKRVLISEARKWRADCIFVGTRNFKSGFERYQLGSVSKALVTNAPCSVEVVCPVE